LVLFFEVHSGLGRGDALAAAHLNSKRPVKWPVKVALSSGDFRAIWTDSLPRRLVAEFCTSLDTKKLFWYRTDAVLGSWSDGWSSKRSFGDVNTLWQSTRMPNRASNIVTTH
jgi:hypothetical protein